MSLLQVSDLHVSIDGKKIINGVDLSVGQGEIHVLMGPNGAGKSTLGYAIMGHPKYQVEQGRIILDGEDITAAPTDVRAKAGLFLSFQTPEEVAGITLESFIRNAQMALKGKNLRYLAYKKALVQTMTKLDMNREYASRYLNVGFSGGEKKKAEILQMLMLDPKVAILDETDSGLDVDAVKVVSKGVEKFSNWDNGLLIITHNALILESLKVNFVHVMVDGRIVKTGDRTLLTQISEEGFQPFISAQAV